MDSHDDLGDEAQRERRSRRAFLARSALASGALITGAGCASLPRASMPDTERRELLARLERGLSRVRSVPRGQIAEQLTWHPRPDLSEEIFRLSMESLVVSDVARSLPEGERIDGPLARRLGDELPVLGRAMRTHHALLARMPGAARDRVARKLRDEPDLPTDIAEWIDRHASELGTATGSRLELRRVARDVKVRMRRQSVGAVIDDAVSKVERAAARSGGAVALGTTSRAHAMTDAIWQQLVPGGGSGSSLTPPGTGLGPPPPVGVSASAADEDAEWHRFVNDGGQWWSPRWASPGDTEIEIGAILMPFGAITCGLLLIVGLIVLLVGVGENAGWDGEPRGTR